MGKGFMRRPVKQIRLNMNKKDIQGFESEVQSYERALSIAFNAINACAAMRRDHTDVEVSKRLDTIETGIQDLSQSLRQRQDLGISSSEATKNFEQFLYAANTFKSSASTVVNGDASTVKGGLGTQYSGSIFGESLSDDRYEIIQSWIPPPSPLGVRGSATNGGSLQGGLSTQSPLPELMAVLETVTQMADQYRNSEQERNSSKDEQLRSLQVENRALEQKLEEIIILTEKQRQDLEEREEKLQSLAKELMDAERERSYLRENSTQQQITAASMTEERDVLRRKIDEKDATLQESKDHGLLIEHELKEHIMFHERMVQSVRDERQRLQNQTAEQAEQLLLERAMRSKSDEALALSKAEATKLNETLLEKTGALSKANADRARLESMVAGFTEQNQHIQQKLGQYRDEANWLKVELQRILEEMDLTHKKLDAERTISRQLKGYLEQSVVTESRFEQEISDLKLDLERSVSGRQDLENRLQEESENFQYRREKLECQLHDMENDLAMMTNFCDTEKTRVDSCEKILAELGRLQEQQSKILSVYRASAENTEPAQQTKAISMDSAMQATSKSVEDAGIRMQQENKTEVKTQEESKRESLTKVETGKNPANDAAPKSALDGARMAIKQKENKPQVEHKTKKMNKGESIWNTDKLRRKQSIQAP
ncbi:hypothetical protein ONS96_014602 [Cadophora gregata f. sp. sojae]|nr:hypothetical protein ONS96_014602 [Cadophora gregata f. sp. sojae]